ncbi:MAG: hypothetical protein H6811_01805 [Phycisphaeraceae bacterium]|nr:hypothetical protein [Phycisphaeraceae bacterium]
MGKVSIAAFRPKPGGEAELMRVIDDRLPLLRSLGLATDRPEIRVRSRDGAIISISEWVSEEAIGRAHGTPEVLALWKRFEACADYLPLVQVPEVSDMFPTFEAV